MRRAPKATFETWESFAISDGARSVGSCETRGAGSLVFVFDAGSLARRAPRCAYGTRNKGKRGDYMAAHRFSERLRLRHEEDRMAVDIRW